jgi:hypothetical protein
MITRPGFSAPRVPKACATIDRARHNVGMSTTVAGTAREAATPGTSSQAARSAPGHRGDARAGTDRRPGRCQAEVLGLHVGALSRSWRPRRRRRGCRLRVADRGQPHVGKTHGTSAEAHGRVLTSVADVGEHLAPAVDPGGRGVVLLLADVGPQGKHRLPEGDATELAANPRTFDRSAASNVPRCLAGSTEPAPGGSVPSMSTMCGCRPSARGLPTGMAPSWPGGWATTAPWPAVVRTAAGLGQGRAVTAVSSETVRI